MHILVAYLLAELHGIQNKFTIFLTKNLLSMLLWAVEFCIIQKHYLGPIEEFS